MVDPEVVRRRLRLIDQKLAALRSIQARGRETLVADPGLQAQVERNLQLAIQAAIDIAVHILAEDSPATPEDYGSAFVGLAGLGVISPDLAGRLKLAAGLRNILVHAYLEVDPARLWDHLADLSDLQSFAASVERYLDR